jgi:hypothetical protein
MKILLMILSGFCVAVVVFSAGVVATIMLLTSESEPVRTADADTSELWTSEPVRVDNKPRQFTRLPARIAPQETETASQAEARADNIDPSEDSIEPSEGEEELIDRTTTASTPPEPMPQIVSRLNAAHIEWCSRRYRSYDPRDNRYNAFSGERRECISPYSGTTASTDAPEQEETVIRASAEPSQQVLSAAGSPGASSGYMDAEHVQSCFARYRSYRPEDNTYQPYGGGPRRQCQ